MYSYNSLLTGQLALYVFGPLNTEPKAYAGENVSFNRALGNELKQN